MVFSSVPTHLHPPNWNQQQLHPGQRPSVAVDVNHQQHQLPPVWPLMAPRLGMLTATSGGGSSVQPGSAISGGGSGSSVVLPGSMAERARLAKIPLPEPGIKCPRCDSTNTKFCYFNNYSLSQPRHFCKACRRYWTHGGALRSVPVGGVCRRNKRNKSSKHSSSSPSSFSSSASATSAAPPSSAAGVMPPQLQPPFGSLHPIWSDRYSTIGESRLGFPGLSSSLHPAVDYQLGDGLGLDLWRLPPTQQFPLLTPTDAATLPSPPPGLSLMSSGSYPFDDATAGSVVEAADLAGQMPLPAGANLTGSVGLITQMCSVKMDDNPQSMATSSQREFLFCGSSDNGADGYGGNGAGGTGITGGGAAPGVVWSDLSAFTSPQPGNIP